MDLYAENILEHYRHPRNKQLLPDVSIEHQEINHSCGDELTIQLQITDGVIEKIGWAGTGCAISQAAMSMLSEAVQETRADGAARLTKDDVYALLGVPIGPRRFQCALLCLHTLKNALRKAEGKQPQSWLETVDLTERSR